MKRNTLLLIFASLLLTGCDLSSFIKIENGANTNPNVDNSNNQKEDTGSQTGGDNNQGGDSGQGSQSGGNNESQGGDNNQGGNSEQGGQTTGTDEASQYSYSIPNNAKYALNEYTTFNFFDKDGALLADDWNYYIKDTHKLSGETYNGNNGDEAGRGIKFEDKNSYMVSPLFNSWKKVEIRFELWFTNKTGNKAWHLKNEPQFTIDSYDETGKHVSSYEFLLEGSDVPSNGSTQKKTVYLRVNTMNYFILNYDNTIEKGSAIYAPVVHSITLKGWDYE